MEAYTMCKIENHWEFTVWLRELKPGFYNNLYGWEVGGKLKAERTHVYLWLTHVDVWQRSVPYCEATFL